MKKFVSLQGIRFSIPLSKVSVLCLFGSLLSFYVSARNSVVPAFSPIVIRTQTDGADAVKMIYSGDTIIVHPTAFRYVENLMLQGWIREIPGCELLQNDDIYLQGQKIDFIKLNGDDLFKEQNHVLLNHLPYYTVDKVLFYHDICDDDKDYGKKDYVMDVLLKREYNVRTIGQISTAGGTNERWLGRVFSLTWTPTSRTSFFVDANNTDEYRKPGRTRIFKDTPPPAGNSKLYSLGADFKYNDRKGIFSEDAKILFDYHRSFDETRTATLSFLPPTNAFGRVHQKDWSHGFKLLTENSFELKRVGLCIETHFDYNRTYDKMFRRTGQFSESPSEIGSTVAVLDSLFLPHPPRQLLDIAVNRTTESADRYFRTWNLIQQFSYHRNLTNDRYIYADVKGTYTDGTRRQFDDYRYDLLQSPQQQEKQNRKKEGINRDFLFQTYFTYGLPLTPYWHLTLTNTIEHKLLQRDKDIYRLDWLSNETDDNLLPSVIDFERCQDHANSWTSDFHNNAIEPLVCLNYQKNDTIRKRSCSLLLQLPVRYIWATEKYSREQQQVKVTDHRWLFRPEVRYDYDTRQFRDHYSFTYQMDMQPPVLFKKVSYTDTSNPLRILKGNPHLKPSNSHSLSFYFLSRIGKDDVHELAFKTTAKFYQDLMAQSVDYNLQTGAYTYQPVNVNGNWNSRSYIRYNLKLDKKKRFDLEISTLFDYYRSVDMCTSLETGKACRHRVDQYIPSEGIKLKYEYGKVHAELIGQIVWNQVHPRSSSEAHIHSVNYNYGMNLQCQLPGQLRLGTSLRMFSRRGYNEPSMNTDNLVWNAQLYRSFFHEKLDLGIKAYDILHQISQTRAAVNAQGRIETWQLSLPNYVMLHLIWKFHDRK